MGYEKPLEYEKPCLSPIDVKKAQGACQPGSSDVQCKSGTNASGKCQDGTNYVA